MRPRAAEEDRLDDGCCEHLVRLYALSGQRELATAVFDDFRRRKRREEEEPSRPLQALVRAIRDGSFPPEARPPGPDTDAPADPTPPAPVRPERAGGPLPLASRFYITRACDREMQTLLEDREGLILVKGPSQTGKTSLIGRGLQSARILGCRVALTSLGSLGEGQKRSAGTPPWGKTWRTSSSWTLRRRKRPRPCAPSGVSCGATCCGRTWDRWCGRSTNWIRCWPPRSPRRCWAPSAPGTTSGC